MLAGDRRNLFRLAGAAPVLDIGCGDGELSFLLESLGFDVLAIDNPPTNYNGTRGFRRLQSALRSSTELRTYDLDDGLQLEGRTFGLALCLGLLYHVKNPLLLLERLAKHARFCLISTRIAHTTPSGVQIAEEPVAYLAGPAETNADPTNFWIFSECGLRRALERTGWEILDHVSTGCLSGSNPVDASRDCRFHCIARSRMPDPWLGTQCVDLDRGWHSMEHRSWRWTERAFSLRVATVSGGARLRLRFHIPEVVHAALGPITLQAGIAGQAIGARDYTFAGEHIFEQALPASPSRTIRIEFALNKALGPTAADARELGIQVEFWKYPEKGAPIPAFPILIEKIE